MIDAKEEGENNINKSNKDDKWIEVVRGVKSKVTKKFRLSKEILK